MEATQHLATSRIAFQGIYKSEIVSEIVLYSHIGECSLDAINAISTTHSSLQMFWWRRTRGQGEDTVEVVRVRL